MSTYTWATAVALRGGKGNKSDMEFPFEQRRKHTVLCVCTWAVGTAVRDGRGNESAQVILFEQKEQHTLLCICTWAVGVALRGGRGDRGALGPCCQQLPMQLPDVAQNIHGCPPDVHVVAAQEADTQALQTSKVKPTKKNPSELGGLVVWMAT